jgi:hypothetical protein
LFVARGFSPATHVRPICPASPSITAFDPRVVTKVVPLKSLLSDANVGACRRRRAESGHTWVRAVARGHSTAFEIAESRGDAFSHPHSWLPASAGRTPARQLSKLGGSYVRLRSSLA